MTTGNNLENISYIPSYNLQEGLHKLYSLVTNTILTYSIYFTNRFIVSLNFGLHQRSGGKAGLVLRSSLATLCWVRMGILIINIVSI